MASLYLLATLSPEKGVTWNSAVCGLAPSRIFLAFVYLEKILILIYTLCHEIYWASPAPMKKACGFSALSITE